MTRRTDRHPQSRRTRGGRTDLRRGARASLAVAPDAQVSDRLADIVRLSEEGRTYAQIAESLGITKNAVALRVKRARDAGRLTRARGHALDSPYRVKGVSTLYKNGRPVLQWEKTTLDQDQLELINRASLAAMVDEIRPVSPVPYALSAAHIERSLLNLYTLTDAHIGMYAAADETGRLWDLGIAEQVILASVTDLIERAPSAETAIIAQLGDFMHFDGLLPLTPTSGHVLDASSRYHQIVEVAVRTLRRAVGLALTRHARVVLVVAEGNHDLSGSVWLRAMATQLYAEEPRVEVLQSALPFYALTHGRVMLGWHHGHQIKPDQMPGFFAAQFAALWGQTDHRYLHCGHRHHRREVEAMGAEVIQHGALAGLDAHAARSGYLSRPRASVMTYHVEEGEVDRRLVDPRRFHGRGRGPSAPPPAPPPPGGPMLRPVETELEADRRPPVRRPERRLRRAA